MSGALGEWWSQRPTGLCWIEGPPGSGKTAMADGLVGLVGEQGLSSAVVTLSTASPDRCLGQLMEAVGGRSRPVHSAGLFAFLDRGPRLLVLDALDCVQADEPGSDGVVADLRLRLLLS